MSSSCGGLASPSWNGFGTAHHLVLGTITPFQEVGVVRNIISFGTFGTATPFHNTSLRYEALEMAASAAWAQMLQQKNLPV